MTEQEALRQARRWWGKSRGGVRPPTYSPRRVFEVGRSDKSGFIALGTGLSWEAAFTDAKKRSKSHG